MSPLPRRLHVARARVALEDIARGSKPADQILEALFRAHKEMGKRDRAAVSDMVYGVLRDVGRLQALAGAAPASWLARHLADLGHAPEAITALELPEPAPENPVAAPEAANLPPDWHARLVRQIGAEDTAALAAALRLPAPTTVRVNTLKATRAEVLSALAVQGVSASASTLAPTGIHLAQRLSKQNSLLLDGEIEPQDEGSQLLALLTGAAAGETVIDWCAGAGGKSLALAAQMQNQGRLVACDITASRLAKIPARAQRAGVDIIETLTLGQGTPPMADVVLVDAPCSGLGTLRRAPDLRLRSFDFAALADLQLRILTEAASHVRPGGRLIYATCSLLQEENEAVVENFLAANPQFSTAAAAADFPSGLLSPQGQLRLWPHRQGSDGFFAALLRRST